MYAFKTRLKYCAVIRSLLYRLVFFFFIEAWPPVVFIILGTNKEPAILIEADMAHHRYNFQ